MIIQRKLDSIITLKLSALAPPPLRLEGVPIRVGALKLPEEKFEGKSYSSGALRHLPYLRGGVEVCDFQRIGTSPSEMRGGAR